MLCYLARLGQAGPRRVSFGRARQGKARISQYLTGLLGIVWFGVAGHVSASQGAVSIFQTSHGRARHRAARQGQAALGRARQSTDTFAPSFLPGKASHRMAVHGGASRGKARACHC